MVTYATSEKGLLKSCSQIFHQQKDIMNTKDIFVNISLVGVSWIHCLIDMKLTLFLNICWELRRYFLRLSFGLTKNLHEILAVNILSSKVWHIYLIPQYVWPRYRLHVIVNSNVGNTFWRQVLQIQIQIQKNWCYWSSIVEFLLRALTLNLNWSQSCLPKYYGLFIVSQIFLKLFGNQRQSFKNHSFWKKIE